jgi:hypothetical protein
MVFSPQRTGLQLPIIVSLWLRGLNVAIAECMPSESGFRFSFAFFPQLSTALSLPKIQCSLTIRQNSLDSLENSFVVCYEEHKSSSNFHL